MKLQSKSKAGEEQLPGKVAPEKQIPAAFLPRKRQTNRIGCLLKVNKNHVGSRQLDSSV